MGLFRKAGSVSHVRATGTMIIVEMLTAQEIANTSILLGVKARPEAPQGYIIDIGPALKGAEWGFEVGDRVLLQGTYVPVPSFKRANERDLGVVMAHDIKCVLVESEED